MFGSDSEVKSLLLLLGSGSRLNSPAFISLLGAGSELNLSELISLLGSELKSYSETLGTISKFNLSFWISLLCLRISELNLELNPKAWISME